MRYLLDKIYTTLGFKSPLHYDNLGNLILDKTRIRVKLKINLIVFRKLGKTNQILSYGGNM